MAGFARFAAVAKAASLALSGETAIVRPMRRVGFNTAATPDPDRAETAIIGIFAEAPGEVFDSARVASYSPVPSAVTVPTVTFEVAALAGLRLVAGVDRITRVETGEDWVLIQPIPDGLGGETWRLAAAA